MPSSTPISYNSTAKSAFTNKERLVELLNFQFNSMERKPSTQAYPLALRPVNGNQRLFYGIPVQSNPFQGWSLKLDMFWTHIYSARLAFWELTRNKSIGLWSGHYFDPKNTVHHSARGLVEFPISATRKWHATPKEIPSKLLDTLNLLEERKTKLPDTLTVEMTGTRIFDIHEGHNPVYKKLLGQDQSFIVNVLWNFESQEVLDEDWIPIEVVNPLYSVVPTKVQLISKN